MPRFKRWVLGSLVVAVTCAPLMPAVAEGHGHGHGHFHGWGLGGAVVGAVVGLVTLPFVIVSAALGAVEPEARYPGPDYDGPRGYAPGPGYYPAPQPYYAPPAYYAPRTYYAPSRSYYPRGAGYYAAPRSNYAPSNSAGHSGYGGRDSYRPGSYAYQQR